MPTAPKILPVKPRYTPPPKASSSARGYDGGHRRQRARLLRKFPICQRCEADWSTDLHHVDGDPFNRSDSNARMVCEACHHGIEHAGR